MGTGSVEGDSDYARGDALGSEAGWVHPENMPAHTHELYGVKNAVDDTGMPQDTYFMGESAPEQIYQPSPQSLTDMDPAMVSSVGGGQAHENRSPFLTVNYIIALSGEYPPRG